MEISPIEMALLLWRAVLWGGLTGLVFTALGLVEDIFFCRDKWASAIVTRRLPCLRRGILTQRERRRGAWAVLWEAIADMLSVLFGGVGVILLCYAYNDGIFRGFVVLGVLAGVLLYFKLMRGWTRRLLLVLICGTLYSFLTIFIILLYPIVKIVYFVCKIINKTTFLLFNAIEKKKKKMYNIEEKICSHDVEEKGNTCRSQGIRPPRSKAARGKNACGKGRAK